MMKLKFLIAMMVCTSTLIACQSNPASLQNQQDKVINKTQDQQSLLTAYTWSFQPKDTNKPIVLTFQQQRIGINAGCNQMGTDFSIVDGKIKTGHVISTMMACAPEIMKQEQNFAKLLQQQLLAFSIDQKNPAQPVLNLTANNRQTYQFVGKATAETLYQSQAEIIFLEILPATKACTGIQPQQCLQVREIKYNQQGIKTVTGDWQLFYDTIEGYQHQTDTRVVLRLKRFERKNPAMDQSKYAYVQDLVVEQELVK